MRLTKAQLQYNIDCQANIIKTLESQISFLKREIYDVKESAKQKQLIGAGQILQSMASMMECAAKTVNHVI